MPARAMTLRWATVGVQGWSAARALIAASLAFNLASARTNPAAAAPEKQVLLSGEQMEAMFRLSLIRCWPEITLVTISCVWFVSALNENQFLRKTLKFFNTVEQLWSLSQQRVILLYPISVKEQREARKPTNLAQHDD